MSNNAAEREIRAVAIGRKNWTFAGSDEGGRRAAVIHSLIATGKLNEVDPQAWLADVLARLPEHPAKRIDELLLWKCKTSNSPLKPPEQIDHSAVRITRPVVTGCVHGTGDLWD